MVQPPAGSTSHRRGLVSPDQEAVSTPTVLQPEGPSARSPTAGVPGWRKGCHYPSPGAGPPRHKVHSREDSWAFMEGRW